MGMPAATRKGGDSQVLSTAVVVLLLLAVIASAFSLGFCVAYAERADKHHQDDSVP